MYVADKCDGLTQGCNLDKADLDAMAQTHTAELIVNGGTDPQAALKVVYTCLCPPGLYILPLCPSEIIIIFRRLAR